MQPAAAGARHHPRSGGAPRARRNSRATESLRLARLVGRTTTQSGTDITRDYGRFAGLGMCGVPCARVFDGTCGGDWPPEAREERSGLWLRLASQGRNESQMDIAIRMKIGIQIIFKNKIAMRSVYTSVRMLERFSRSTVLYHFVPHVEARNWASTAQREIYKPNRNQ